MDILQSDLFLERLEVWRATSDEYYHTMLVEDHLYPLMVAIISKAYFLPEDDITDAVAKALHRCSRSLPTYNPERRPPFHYFSRIAYNERSRAIKNHFTSKRINDVSIHDTNHEDTTYESAEVFTDRKSAAAISPEAMDFKRLVEQIPKLSPDHKAVFNSLMYGEGMPLRTGRMSISGVVQDTGLEKERVKEIIEDVKSLIRQVAGEPDAKRQKTTTNVDKSHSRKAGRIRRKRHKEVLRPRYSYTQTELPMLCGLGPEAKQMGAASGPVPRRNSRRGNVLGRDNVRKHRAALEANAVSPAKKKSPAPSHKTARQSLRRTSQADNGSAVQLLLFPRGEHYHDHIHHTSCKKPQGRRRDNSLKKARKCQFRELSANSSF